MEREERLTSLPEEDRSFQMLQESGLFDIQPCTASLDFEDTRRFQKLRLDPGQRMQVSALMQQLPTLLYAKEMTNAYTVRFPRGLPHTLTALKQGGWGGMIQGKDGRFVGAASFYPLATQAALLGVFSAMSAATGQYYLAEINSKMEKIQLKLDKILEFLYGDKKAELLAELSFIKYACDNFRSIMPREAQRQATIISLQAARRVAMKDIEFYMGDLDAAVNESGKDYAAIEAQAGRAFQIRESLSLSVQLYAMSNLLEMYYAENHDPDYVAYLRGDMFAYIDKCDKRMLSSFSVLNARIETYQPKWQEKVDKSALLEKTGVVVEALRSGEESPLRQSLEGALRAAAQQADYYLSKDGNVYAKLA